MLQNCVVVVCGVVFAYSEPVRADDKPAAEKTFAFHMKDAKWEDVFDWYAKETGLKAEVKAQPKGTFTCIPGKDRKFTIGELTDLINGGLAEQKVVLIPNRKTFAVVSAEGKIDPKLIPVVELTDLPQFGRTAIVEVTIPVAIEVDEEIAGEVKKILTPVGEILNVKGKSIVVRDTVDNVLRLREILRPF